jgi:GT2 family glycosyltransferase
MSSNTHPLRRGSSAPSCCVLVLTYNGRSHLECCLPSLLRAARKVPGGCTVIVVDNRSNDNSVEWLRQHYREVEVQIAERNDYLFSLNRVVESRSEDVVVILNNDMHFDDDFIAAMLPHFRSADVFAVSAKVLDWEGKRVTAGQRVAEKRKLWFCKSWKLETTEPRLTLDAGGGCASFRRKMYVQLGGFDPLYRPGYWEDTDLSYRAWRSGWKIIYEPSSIIYHRVGATMDETQGGRPAVTRLIRRNEILFALRNVGGWGFAVGYLALLPVRIVRNAVQKNHSFWQGALQALPRIPAALMRRATDRFRRSDDDFLQEIQQCVFVAGNERSEDYELSKS